MTMPSVKVWTPPVELAELFGDPPLAISESLEDYNKLFAAIAEAAKPSDAIAWLFTRDFVDLTWEIRRERGLKLRMIKAAEENAVARILCPPSEVDWDPDDEALAEASEWARDPESCREIGDRLAQSGYDARAILAKALGDRGLQIDAFDRRIASYELRRMTALRECERYNEKLARRLEAVSSNVIEGEFAEAAE